MPPVTRAGDIAKARQRFFAGGALPEGLVAHPILRSWQRCAEHGLSSSARPRAEPVSARELRAVQEQNEKLRRLTRSEVESLHAEARLTDSVVILTDASGFVLDMVGSLDFADRASQVALRPGVIWNEATAGTNAIGTALVELRPIGVHGAEHFFEPHRMLACAAAPIIDPRGALAGVLDMSGHASIQHVHGLGLVNLAVEQIEHRFFEHGFEHCAVLRFHQHGEFLGTAREGILAFEGDRLVAANRHGLRMMGIDWSALDRTELRELFQRAEPSTEIQKLRAQRGDAFIGRMVQPARSQARPARQVGREPEPVFSPKVASALTRAIRLLDANVPVLVQGETGVGKEVFVRHVHAASNRCGKPFIAVNCAALPETLIEAELFGYDAGAFTGARQQGSKGLLRQADGGVLFLDEIGDMPLALQARLLRVLQDREISPLGGGKPVRVDFALVCATHRPLEQLVGAGAFRQDLLFRIAQYVIELPALRTLPDRMTLVRGMWKQFGGPAAGIALAPETELRLANHEWPGNYRQLAGTLRALLALAEPGSTIDADALSPEIRQSQATMSPAAGNGDGLPLARQTLDAMRAALEASNGNVSGAARRLGIDRSTLYRRLLWDKSAG